MKVIERRKSVDYNNREGSSPSAPNIINIIYIYIFLETMCICLNCDRIISCKIYNLISKKHNENQFIISLSFVFMPQSPILQILLSSLKNGTFIEWDVNECLSFEDNPGVWLIASSFSESYFYDYYYLRYDATFV